MNVAMMQPTFLPWLGYFELISRADKFILLDDFQFVYQSFHQRNRLFTNKDTVSWLTVPVDKQRSYKQPLNETFIREDKPWRKKIWRSIEMNYKKAPYFEAYKDALMPIILTPQGRLDLLNVALIRALSKILGFDDDKFILSSNLGLKGKRSEHVKTILEAANATCYLSARGSFDYMLEDGVFPLENIDVRFQNAVPGPYPQISSSKGFVPYLSALDALFNIGAEETARHINTMTEHWSTWDEMKRDTSLSV